MTRGLAIALLLCALATGVGCGKYGKPVRTRPAAASPSAPENSAAPAAAPDPGAAAIPAGEDCEEVEEKPAP